MNKKIVFKREKCEEKIFGSNEVVIGKKRTLKITKIVRDTQLNKVIKTEHNYKVVRTYR